MTPLTQTAYASRLLIKFGVIALVGMIVGRVVLTYSIQLWRTLNPPPAPPPTMAFGTLPSINFPANDTPQLSYKLETATGGFPKMSDRANVYLMPIERPNLLALEKAKEQAADLGFKSEPIKVSDVMYRWSKDLPYPSKLQIFIYNGAFNLTTDWSYDPAFLQVRKLPTEPQAVDQTRNFLSNANLHDTDLEDGDHSIRYLKASGRDYLETISLSEADFLEVNLFRAPIEDEYSVVTSDPKKGIVQAIFSGNDQARIVSLDYNYFPVDYDSVETYPIKTPEQAWQELTTNQGFVAYYDKKIDAVTVRRVELGYFDSYNPQKYLQPIYIFKGDNGFIAYVEAVIKFDNTTPN